MAALSFLILLMVYSTVFAEENVLSPCFQFSQVNGTGFASFRDGLPIEYSAHFRIEIHTESEGGLIYYAEANYLPEKAIDFEALYLKDGYVHYLIFNPSVHGVGDTFGFYANSSKKLNDNKWHTIEIFRNRESNKSTDDGGIMTVTETGLIVDGNKEVDDRMVDYRPRHGFEIGEPLYIGGNPMLEERTSRAVAGFKGKIRGFKELSNGEHVFHNTYQKNEAKKCIDDLIPDPV